jgi:hypothetical protein
MFYIKISQFGDEGRFLKRENVTEELNKTLNELYLKVCENYDKQK